MEIQELQEDASKAGAVQEWYSEKIEEISIFVSKTEKWLDCRKNLHSSESKGMDQN